MARPPLYAIKLTLTLLVVSLYLFGSGYWFAWIVPVLLFIGTDQALIALFAGSVAWMLLTFGFIIHSIKSSRPAAGDGR